mgnify:CR=1 FL=1
MSKKNRFWESVKKQWREITSVSGELDTAAATEKIRGGIYMRGTTIWILVCSIVIASVGLNVNSIPVIIGAMLVSPLMGPIFGMGLSLCINDRSLFGDAIKNFLVMVLVSLLSSFLYFKLTPLKMANPTELLARTSPTIFDVFIAFAGGIAGMLEQSRKDRGTVLSGVAIATALMPPLCTAGFGLASGNMHYFFGALYLFLINTVFILIAAYLTASYLHFEKVGEDNRRSRRFRTFSYIILAAIIIPSIFSAIAMIRRNNIQRETMEFIEENKSFGNAYIYNYEISGDKATIFYAGDLGEGDIDYLQAAAARHGLGEKNIEIKVRSLGTKADELLKGVYERNDEVVAEKDAQIKALEDQLRSAVPQEIPYQQIGKELKYKYPSVKSFSITRGTVVQFAGDTLEEAPCTNAIILTQEHLQQPEIDEITRWMRLRLDDTTIVVSNIVENK